MMTAAGLFIWLTAAESSGTTSTTLHVPTSATDTAPVSQRDRDDAFRRAAVYLDPSGAALDDHAPPLDGDRLTCRFVAGEPSGTSPKFLCALDNGDIVKVKYGRNPEIQAEVAATRLLRMLGLAADDVSLVRTVRCYGCPRFPFLAVRVLSLTSAVSVADAQGYTDFEWAAVERKFPARAIESASLEGWSWWELQASQAPRADLDALRLLAVFLAHWDNKAANQRLVCLDAPRGPADNAGSCQRPLLMIQDLGATFGPEKVNLGTWSTLPVWSDRTACRVSMAALPWHGATFREVTISDAGRLRLAQQLSAIDDGMIRQLFTGARFDAFYAGTDDRRDIDAWTQAFRSRVAQIVTAGPCESAHR